MFATSRSVHPRFGVIALVVLAFAMIGGLGVDVAGQGRRGPHHSSSSSDAKKYGIQNGYSAGYEAGIHDRKTRHSSNYRDHTVYRDGNRGYNRSWGSLTFYRQSFQGGYAIGYADGYHARSWQSGYGPRPDWVDVGPVYRPPSRPYGYSNPYDWRQRATYFGYYDGYYRGEYDRRQGYKQPKPMGHGAYETAANGWAEDLCDLGDYQRVYRQYFTAGYADGFGRRAYNRKYNRNW